MNSSSWALHSKSARNVPNLACACACFAMSPRARHRRGKARSEREFMCKALELTWDGTMRTRSDGMDARSPFRRENRFAPVGSGIPVLARCRRSPGTLPKFRRTSHFDRTDSTAARPKRVRHGACPWCGSRRSYA